MRTLKLLLAGVTFLWSTVWCATARAQPFFMGLGDLPGYSFNSGADGVSDDGSVVVGWSANEAFRWTQGTGMVGLGRPPGAVNSSLATGVSADGSVVVGGSSIFGGTRPPRVEAFRWTQTGGMVGLGDLPGGNFQSYAYAVSADGSIVVGRGAAGSRIEAFRWMQTDGMVGMGDLPGGSFESNAYAVSDDGSVIVGSGISASGREAFRWRQTGGMVGLGDLPGGNFSSTAYAVSADGSVVVGFGNSASGQEAFRWTQGLGMVGLGDLPGGIFQSNASAVSADGSVVVGYGSSAAGYEPFVWDATHGMRSLRDVLVNHFGLGASLAGWTLTSANDISADGQFIVGSGTNPNGDTEAWIARLSPTLPGDFNNDATVDAADYVVWRKNPGGIYTQNDYNTWRAHFGQTAGGGAVDSLSRVPASAEPLSAAVPEASTLMMFVVAMIMIPRQRMTVINSSSVRCPEIGPN